MIFVVRGWPYGHDQSVWDLKLGFWNLKGRITLAF